MSKKSKSITLDEFKELMDRSDDWSKRCRIPAHELPQEMQGVQQMTGYEDTYYSGSMAYPDGEIVGSFDAIREDLGYGYDDVGRYKKYQYKVFLDGKDQPQACSVVERKKKQVEGHHMTEQDYEDEFLVVTLEKAPQ